MSDDKRKINWSRIIIYVSILVLIITFSLQNYNNRGWEKEEIFENWEFYDLESAENGYGCVLIDCNIINKKDNTEVKECTCKNNGKLVRTIAMNKREFYVYKNFKIIDYRPLGGYNETNINN